jgi:hypothetical protein
MYEVTKSFLPVTQNATGSLPAAPPEEIMARLAGTLGAAMTDLSSGGFRRIIFKGRTFTLNEGGAKTQILHNGGPATFLDFVILNVAADRHYEWYEKPYDPRSTEAAGPPTAVWWSKSAPPPNVPDWVMTTKRIINGIETNHYQTRQRVVGVLMQKTEAGLGLDTEKLYVMDFSGMSIYSKKETPPAYTFKGLMQYCHSTGILPLSFPVRAIFTPDSVPVLRFHPWINPRTNKLAFFSDDLVQALSALAVSNEVVSLLDVVKTSKDVQNDEDDEPRVVQPDMMAPAPPAQAQAQDPPAQKAPAKRKPREAQPAPAAPASAADDYYPPSPEGNNMFEPDLGQATATAVQSAQTMLEPAGPAEPLNDDAIMAAMEALVAP